MEIGELAVGVGSAYHTLLTAHMWGLKRLFPDVNWNTREIVIVPEENSYVNNVIDLMSAMKDFGDRNGFNVKVYNRWDKQRKVFIAGRHIGGDKAQLVCDLGKLIDDDLITPADSILSFGDRVLAGCRTKIKDKLLSTGEVTGMKHTEENDALREYYENKTIVSGVFDELSADADGGVLLCGAALLDKLVDEMLLVTIVKEPGSNPKVQTGGKKSNGGLYTRDDLFSALLVASTGIDYMIRKMEGFAPETAMLM